MSNEDVELFEQIRVLGDKGEDMRPGSIDSLVVATRLVEAFPHRTVDEIQEMIRGHFRGRGLVLADD